MNRYLSTLAVISLTLCTPLHADESHHPENQDTHNGMSLDEHQMNMDDHMEKMNKVMDKIHSTKDPVERCKLTQEHMQSMHEGMAMMHGMGGETKEMPVKKYGRAGPGDCTTVAQQEMMSKRMDMMDQMMNQMKMHQHEPEPQHEHGQ